MFPRYSGVIVIPLVIFVQFVSMLAVVCSFHVFVLTLFLEITF